MRIAYVSADSGVPVYGCKGSSVHVQSVVRAFRALGHEVELFAARVGGSAPADLATVPLLPLPLPEDGRGRGNWDSTLALNGVLRLALARRRRFDLVYERYSLWSFGAMEWASRAGIPSVLEVNAPLIEEQATHRGLGDRAAAERVAARAFGRAGALAAVSEAVAGYLRGHLGSCQRVHVIPNGVDPDRFAPGTPPAWQAPPGSFTVGFLGTLKPWHGLPVLLAAFARLTEVVPGAVLLLVGDGPERSRLEALASELGVRPRVHFAGAVPPEAVAGWLAAMDCAVAPYEALPGFYFSPLKVYEYMAAGLPVVASAVGQLVELVTPATGVPVAAGDVAALAAALARLAKEPGTRARLGAAARDHSLRHHTWRAAAARLLRVAAVGPTATATEECA